MAGFLAPLQVLSRWMALLPCFSDHDSEQSGQIRILGIRRREGTHPFGERVRGDLRARYPGLLPAFPADIAPTQDRGAEP